MSDERKQIFTHPDIVQAGDYQDQYNANLMCSVCQSCWGDHLGWTCAYGQRIDVLLERPATVSHRCARCNATIEPDTAEQHHDKCFRVGDYVRWDNPIDGNWIEGSLRGIVDGVAIVQVDKSKRPLRWSPGTEGAESVLAANLSRIQRPGQAAQERESEQQRRIAVVGELFYTGKVSVEQAKQMLDSPDVDPPTLSDRLGHPVGAYRTPHVLSVKVTDPLDVKYGGVTLRHLLAVSEACRREGHPNHRTAWRRLSDAQRAAVSAHWSAQLRARIAAAKERERLQVCCEMQDAEDLSW